jgi:hypothetical protein
MLYLSCCCLAACPCRGDKSFFVTAAVGGAVLLGALYLFLNSQTQL